MQAWQALLCEMGVEHARCIPFSACRVTREHLLSFAPQYAILFLVPYLTEAPKQNSVSLYSASEDYHLFFASLFDRCIPALQEAYPHTRWQGASDRSPIDERHAAATAGLGMIGDNGLLISRDYGSYVFLGALFTTAELTPDLPSEITHCRRCGACHDACPSKDLCLSALTQKKGALTEAERTLIAQNGTAWGCDICQLVCPENRGVKLTSIPFFYENRMPSPTKQDILDLPDPLFARRAYAWRRRETVLRNFEILEGNKT